MKKTLNESTILRFMKLADIESLSESFVGADTVAEEQETLEETDETVAEETLQEMPMDDDMDMEHAHKEGMGHYDDDMTEGEHEMDAMEDEVADALGADMGESPMVDVPQETVEAIVDAVVSAIGDVTDTDISVTSDEEAGEEMPMDDMDMEPAEDLADLADAEEEAAEDELAIDEQEELAEEDTVEETADQTTNASLTEDEFLSEITKRVAKRLLSLNKED